MTDLELLTELETRQALIVHCSRLGKGDVSPDGLFFPEDLRKAIQLCSVDGAELSCSVIWPDHIKTFGTIGIVLKPRTTRSITSICKSVAGSHVDPISRKRKGFGKPFSKQTVVDTFVDATEYNEWVVRDADTIGIFIHPREPLKVGIIVRGAEMEGYVPSMGDFTTTVPVDISISNVAAKFPNLPIYSFQESSLVEWKYDGSGYSAVRVDSAILYGCGKD